MWKILGEDAMFLDISAVFKARVAELADATEAAVFGPLLEGSEVTFMINGETEVSTFFITVPDSYTPEDIQKMADVILGIAKAATCPMIAADSAEQRYQIIINNAKEPELIGLNKTPGMSSGEIFKPIFKALDSPGRLNKEFEN